MERRDPGALHSRREFLAGATAAVGLAACASSSSSRAGAAKEEPAAIAPPLEERPLPFEAPDLAEERVVRTLAARRPYRRGRVRLDAERMGDVTIVHSWGHGGAGLTLALGSAEEVVGLVRAHLRAPAAVTVVGAGVIGLAAAAALADAGYRPRVVAERFSPDTTSDVAGGQWAPSIVAKGDDDESRARFERMLLRSARLVDALVGRGVGVHRRTNWYEVGGGASLAAVPDHVLPPEFEVERLPFAGIERRGAGRDTYLIEPAPFLAYLTRRLEAAGVAFERRRITGASELAHLGTAVVVCCVGLGGGELFHDAAMRPLKGHLLHFPPGDHPWLLTHGDGYVFPRSDAVVVGGSVESDPVDDVVDPATCERIRRANATFFAGVAPRRSAVAMRAERRRAARMRPA